VHFTIDPASGGLEMDLEFDRTQFDAPQIESYARYYLEALDRLVRIRNLA